MAESYPETIVSYIEKNLSSGETVLYKTRLHWAVMAPTCIASALLAAAGIGLFFVSYSKNSSTVTNAGGLLFLLVAAILVVVAYSKRAGTEMAVTDKRVLVKTGILSRRSIEIMLSKIESIVVDQTLAGRIFDFGTIVVRGTGGTPEPFAKIAHPLEFRCRVQEQIDKLQDSRSFAATFDR